MIEISNLHKSYKTGANTLHVLKGINFSVAEGELLSIMGSSGSGKSTLLNILGMLDEAKRLWPYDDADRMFFGVGDPAAAIAVAEKYAEQSEDPEEVYGDVAWAYFLDGNYERAL